MRRAMGIWIAALLLALGIADSAQAVPGDLDTSFGNTGVVHWGGTAISGATSALELPNGNIIVGGYKQSASVQDKLIFYSPSGVQQQEITGWGYAQDFGYGYRGVNQLTYDQASGRVYAVSGSAGSSMVAKVTTSGVKDLTFGPDGTISLSGSSPSGGGYYDGQLALQDDGRFLFFSTYTTRQGRGYPWDHRFNAYRIQPNGATDLSFNGTGQKALPYSTAGKCDTLSSGLLLNGGGSLAVGNTCTSTPGSTDTTIYAVSDLGDQVTTFGTGGVMVDQGGPVSPVVLAGRTPDEFYLVGRREGSTDWEISRYTADGGLDTSFGVSGRVYYDMDGHTFRGARKSPSGEILMWGGQRVALAKANGELDDRFAGDGEETYSYCRTGPHYNSNPAPLSIFNAAFTANNKVLLVGKCTYYIVARLDEIPALGVDEESLYGVPEASGVNRYVGDPINAATGNFLETVEDASYPSPGLSPQISRFYNSQSERPGPFGRGWSFLYDASLSENTNGSVDIREGDGAVTHYSEDSGAYTAPEGVRDELTGHAGGWTLTRRNGIEWEFDLAGKLQAVTDRNGNQISFDYTGGNLTTLTTPRGDEVELTYDTSDQITEITDWDNRSISYTYSSGDLATVTDREGAATSYTYDSDHNLVEIQDPGTTGDPGQLREITYDEFDRAVDVKADGGVGETQLTYSLDPYRTQITDALGNTSVYYFDDHGRVSAISDPDHKWITFERDAGGNVIEETDQTGRSTLYDYNSAGDLTEVQDPKPDPSTARPTHSWTYNSHGQVTSETDPAGWTTDHTYDSNGNLTETQLPSPDGVEARPTISWTYNSKGQPLTLTDELGTVTQWEYNTEGELTKETEPAASGAGSGEETTYSHDALHRLTAETDALGGVTSYSYDSEDRLTELELPSPDGTATGPVESYTYDPRGNLTQLEDPRSQVWEYEYDPHNRLASSEDPTGKLWETTYDQMGNVVSETAPGGAETTYEYDSQGRLIRSVFPDGTSGGVETELNRNAVGQVTASINPLGDETDYSYDGLGRLVEVTDAEGGTAEYEYNSRGLLTKITNPNGHSWERSYDRLGRLDSITDPLSNTTTYTYDAASQLVAEDDGVGDPNSYVYDNLGQLTQNDYPAGTPDESFTYDELGRLTEVQDASGITELSYDGLGRLLKEELPGGREISREWDPAGDLTQVTYPGGLSESFTYDAAGRPLTQEGVAGDEITYSYGADARLGGWSSDSGLAASYTYDPLGRLSALQTSADSGVSALASQDFTYDKDSNVTALSTDVGSVSSDSMFTYDDLGRLTNETHTGDGAEAISYSYDDAGNRTELTRGSDVTSYSYNAAERMTGVDRSGSSDDSTLSYSDNGSLTSETRGTDTTGYSYDAANRLTGVDMPGSGSDESYTLDASDRVVESSVGSDVERSLYDGSRLVITEEESGATDPATYYRALASGAPVSVVESSAGLAGLSSAITAGGAVGYHLDGQGSPLALTGATGAIEKTHLYGAFGEERYSAGAALSQLGYLSRPLNPATKLHNFQARSYSASDGRFTQVDPIAGDLTRPQSLNPYAYGLNNPLKWEDSAGQFPIVSSVASGLNAGWDAWWQSDIGVGTQMCRLAIPGCEYYASDQLAKYGWDSEEFIRESGVDIALAAIPGGKILKAGEELNGARKALNAADELAEDSSSIVIRNRRLASSQHPETGVPFNNRGFPDFEGWYHRSTQSPIKVDKMTGVSSKDSRLADKVMRQSDPNWKRPNGYTWHHMEDGETMVLVKSNVHGKTGHTGGAAIIRSRANGG